MTDATSLEFLLHLLRSGSEDEREHAARALGRSGDPASIRASFAVLEASSVSAVVASALEDGLVEGAPGTVTPLLELIEAELVVRSRPHAAFALGEIAYHQRGALDPRIVPLALRVFDLGAAVTPPSEDSVRAQKDAIYVLRQCAWTAPIPDARERLRGYVRSVAEGRIGDGFDVNFAWDTLFADLGPLLFEELRALHATLPEAHPLRARIADYLEEKAQGAVFS